MDRQTHGKKRRVVIFLQDLIFWLSYFWFGLALLVPLSFLILAVLAPAFLRDGNQDGAEAIYAFMRIQNHQLPERSYFILGTDGGINSFEREELLSLGAEPERWEAYTGNRTIGFKTALNQRMFAIMAAALFGALLWLGSRGRLRISGRILLLLFLPLLLDGVTHMITDFTAIEWRLDNQWAHGVWGANQGEQFYSGTTAGTLNWWLRTATGLVFGLALSVFLLNQLDQYFGRLRTILSARRKNRKISPHPPG